MPDFRSKIWFVAWLQASQVTGLLETRKRGKENRV